MEADSVYMVKGEDGNVYGVFTLICKAQKLKSGLIKDYGAYFTIETFKMGPAWGYAHYLKD